MTLLDHLPVLVVLLPLTASPLCVFIGRASLSWLITLVACWSGFAIACLLLLEVSSRGTLSYLPGGWDAPWGIEIRIDLLGAYVLLIVTVMAALVTSFARLSVLREIPLERITFFYASFLLTCGGLIGITVTGDAFNLFVFLEIASLSSYALISMGRDRRALNASFQYLVMGTIGASFILIGIGFLYMMTGTLNMQDLAHRLPPVSDTTTVRAAFAFLTVGLSLKLALFPLHLWLPNAYAHAPSVISAFLAATSTKVAFYALLRFILTVFGLEFSLDKMPLDTILLVLGTAGILSASVVAIFEHNMKRMFAYSSIAQIGYMVLSVSMANTAGIAAAVLHVFNHAMMKATLFLALGAVFYRINSINIKDFRGLARYMPWTMASIVIGGLSLIGVPATAGFISKWYLVLAVLEQGMWPLALVVLIGSLLAVIYVWRIVEAAYFGTAEHTGSKIREAPWSMLAPIWVLVAANFYFGINTGLTAGLAERVAYLLVGAVP